MEFTIKKIMERGFLPQLHANVMESIRQHNGAPPSQMPAPKKDESDDRMDVDE